MRNEADAGKGVFLTLIQKDELRGITELKKGGERKLFKLSGNCELAERWNRKTFA